ncbi:MAG: ThuA domain-containing protein [Planctomycetota bacterium]
MSSRDLFCRAVVAVSVLVPLLVAPAAAQVAAEDSADGSGFLPGVSVDVYTVDAQVGQYARVAPDQAPNIAARRDVIDLTADDFGAANDSSYTHVTGDLLIEEPGEYVLRLSARQGAKLFIDDFEVGESKHGQLTTVELTFSKGAFPIRIEQWSNTWRSTLRLEWKVPGSESFEIVPSTSLRTPAGVTRVVAPGFKRVLDPSNPGRPGFGQPLDAIHPMWSVDPVHPDGHVPQVGGMAYLGDGRLAITEFKPMNSGRVDPTANGVVHIIDGADGDSPKITQTIEGFSNPLGIALHKGHLYVAEIDQVTQLSDYQGDGVYSDVAPFARGWLSDNYHHFTFGPVISNGKLYVTLSTSIGFDGQKFIRDGDAGFGVHPPHRGSWVEIDPETRQLRYLAGGLRTPNGLFVGPEGEQFVGENQGRWKPANGLYHLEPGRFYGHYNDNAKTNRYPDGGYPADFQDQPVTPPAVVLPHGQISASPTDSVMFESGPFKGQALTGDVKVGGLRRIHFEKIDGRWQGTAFRHSQGFEGGVNRLAWGDGGELYVGAIGASRSWSWRTTTAGLQRLTPTGEIPFEMHSVSVESDGVTIRFTEPADIEHLADPSRYTLSHWYYRPTSTYGGPKVNEKSVEVSSAEPSSDGMSVKLVIPDMEAGRVMRMSLDVLSAAGGFLWSNEAWTTIHRIPGQPEPAEGVYREAKRVLVFSKTDKFRHASIPEGKKMVEWVGKVNGFDTTFTEDSSFFNSELLADFDAVLLLNTSGDIFNPEQEAAFKAFVQGGGGVVGIHAATDTEHGWPWFGRMIGARFKNHPKPQPADVIVEDAEHPTMAGVPNPWTVFDEWYNFKEVQPDLHVLLSLDGDSYEAEPSKKMEGFHPIVWCQEFEGGRVFYIGLGDRKEQYSNRIFRNMVRDGVWWVLGEEDEIGKGF